MDEMNTDTCIYYTYTHVHKLCTHTPHTTHRHMHILYIYTCTYTPHTYTHTHSHHTNTHTCELCFILHSPVPQSLFQLLQTYCREKSGSGLPWTPGPQPAFCIPITLSACRTFPEKQINITVSSSPVGSPPPNSMTNTTCHALESRRARQNCMQT